ncbi:MAG: class F sortase [Sporichthyaceae bacterium]
MIAGGVALAVLGVGSIALGAAARRSGPPAPPPGGIVAAGYSTGVDPLAPSAPDQAGLEAATVETSGPDGVDRSPATHLSFPRMRIDTELMVLDLNPDGTVAVPPDDLGAPAGWYGRGVSPGEVGPTVLLGHVDTKAGPGVFYGLGATRVGDRMSVRRADGRVVDYEVQRVSSYPQTAFPTEEVYGSTPGSELRLITCGGRFDRARGGYQDNIVVFATMVGTPSAPTAPPQPAVGGTSASLTY